MSDRPEVVLRGKRFDIERRAIPTRDGGSEQREVMVHPGAVVLLPILPDGRVVLIRNYRFSIQQTLWELPAGTRAPDEEPLLCAARELEEETGYRAGKLTPLCAFYVAPGVSTERMFAFVASELTATAQRLDPTEQIEVHPTTSERVLEMIQAGDIADAKTIATFLFYRTFNAANG